MLHPSLQLLSPLRISIPPAQRAVPPSPRHNSAPPHSQINLPFAVKTGTISKGLKYSLATGNWGQQGTQGVKAGVSQVRARARERRGRALLQSGAVCLMRRVLAWGRAHGLDGIR